MTPNERQTARDELTRARLEFEKLQGGRKLRFTAERIHKTEADLDQTIKTLEAGLKESPSAP